MLSYWESQSFLTYDFIIIGSGITGLSTAIELKEKFSERSVLILERGLLPTGASTKNAGFACMGSVTELLDDLEHTEIEKVIELFKWRKTGLEILRRRLGDKNIDYKENGSFELISNAEEDAPNKIEFLNKLLKDIFPHPIYKLSNDKIDKFGFSKKHVISLIETLGEGELNTGKMMKALIKKASQLGIEIKTGANVKEYTQLNNGVSVVVENVGIIENKKFNELNNSVQQLVFKASKLILCTNAFTPELLNNADVKPGRGQVLITNPIKNLKFKGTFHFDKGYYYFREVDGRILLGGGRNLDFEGESTTCFDLTNKIQDDLERKLREIIIPDVPFSIEQRWSGIMAFGKSKFPIIKQISNDVYGGFRLGGMGVALGSKVAKELVEILKFS